MISINLEINRALTCQNHYDPNPEQKQNQMSLQIPDQK